MSVGIRLTISAAARPRIATAVSFARLIVGWSDRQRFENRGVANVDDQRIPLRHRQQRTHRHRQRDVEVAVVQRGERQPRRRPAAADVARTT